MPKSKKPRKKISSSRILSNPISEAFVSADVQTFNRLVGTGLADGSLSEDRLRKASKLVPAERAGDFMNAAHHLAGSAAGLSRTPDGEAILVKCEAFTISVTGPASAFRGALGAGLMETSRVLRACGFSKLESNVFVCPWAYDLKDLAAIEARAMNAACRAGLSMSATSDPGHILEKLPIPAEIPAAGTVTRTLLGFRFAEVCEEDSDLFSENFWDRTDVSERIDAYQRLMTETFDDRCIIGIPSPWVTTVGAALSMKLDDALARVDETFLGKDPEVILNGDLTTLRFRGDEDLVLEVPVPASVLVRAWDELEIWIAESKDAPDLNVDEDEEPDENEDALLTRLLGIEAEPVTGRVDDTTNLVRFRPRTSR